MKNYTIPDLSAHYKMTWSKQDIFATHVIT